MIGLYPLEIVLRSHYRRSNGSPPVFIVGPPRSGTTLLYELLVSTFRFSYFSNFAHRFYYTPVAITWIARSVIRRWHGQFESRYGYIAGWGAPNEGGWIWNRWLKNSVWLDGKCASSLKLDELRSTVTGMAGCLGAPYLNKNVMHGNRIRLLDAIYPGCLFIQMRRDPADNVRSIMRGQKENTGAVVNSQNWWSVQPSTAPMYYDSSRMVQACAQVAGVAEDISNDMKHIGPDRLIVIEYKSLCEGPDKITGLIAEFLELHGVKILKRAPGPDKFDVRTAQYLDAESEKSLSDNLTRFFP